IHAQEAAAPMIKEARRLDALLEPAKRDAERALGASAEAGKRAAEQRARVKELGDSIATREVELSTAAGWLDGRASLAPLARQWVGRADGLARNARARERGREAAERVLLITPGAEKRGAEVAAATVAAVDSAAALLGAEEGERAAANEAAALPRASLREERD